ncbi:hypothetical protein LJC18_03430 [Lachnospiraceae bacterium OttesenSCG-928-E19]|nr:hypothetical protein [Lachnospiraceae bacterium OttesenSCG-928-E19]
MAEIKVFVSDNTQSREFHAKKIYREKYIQSQKISMIVPGTLKPNDKPKVINGIRGGSLGEKHYVRDFSFGNMQTLYRMKNDLIIENVHLLSVKSVDDLIKLNRQYNINIYLFSKMHNMAGGIYPILNHFADNGFEPELLEDFATVQEIPVKNIGKEKIRKK